MAQGKDSFVLYTSYLEIFERLSDSEAGKLIKHILRYVNDLNPSMDDNRLLDLIFEGSIKQDLKKDLKKWEERCKINKANGSKGGAPKGNANAKKTTENNQTVEKTTETTRYDSDSDNDLNTPFIPPSGGTRESTDPSWKTDYKIYLDGLRKEFRAVKKDADWIAKQEKFNPGVDIILSIEKACTNYWATEGGWKKKKRSRIVDIDWRSTFANAIPLNRVFKPRVNENEQNSKHCDL